VTKSSWGSAVAKIFAAKEHKEHTDRAFWRLFLCDPRVLLWPIHFRLRLFRAGSSSTLREIFSSDFPEAGNHRAGASDRRRGGGGQGARREQSAGIGQSLATSGQPLMLALKIVQSCFLPCVDVCGTLIQLRLIFRVFSAIEMGDQRRQVKALVHR
jgi:hypothetical protein